MRKIAMALALLLAPMPSVSAAASSPAIGRTTSGIEYQELRKGKDKGAHPAATDSVPVHYRGMLAAGRTFEASRYADPVTLSLYVVITGWTEAVQQLPV